jgi:TATA-box binding protein (TBP) (component of TFIID and TFIIIB)
MWETIFNVANIGKYLELSHNKIFSVKYGSSPETNRTLDNKKKRRTLKNKKKKRNFYNQVSIEAKSDKGKIINIKLFSNGSIQMTGCKDIENSLGALNNLFNELKKIKAAYDPITKKIIDKPYVTDSSKISLDKILKLRIAMINSNFNIGFKIDRDKLFDLMHIKGHTECTYDPIIHACVNIKYDSDGKAVSIFVFESGSIIITGANNGKHICDAYNFINKLLLNNYNIVYKCDILSNSTILMYLS